MRKLGKLGFIVDFLDIASKPDPSNKNKSCILLK